MSQATAPGARMCQGTFFISIDVFFKNEDILQEISKHSEYNIECEEVLSMQKEKRIVCYDEDLHLEAYRFE